MQIKPLGERVLLQIAPAEEKTTSGIIIPTSAQEKTNQGVIVAIGKEVESLKVGDKVIYDKYAGTSIQINQVDHLLVSVKDVLAVVE